MSTQILHPQFGREFLAALSGALRSAGALFSAPAETAAGSRQRLRDLAAEYDATQPSYAADLRAAADRHVGSHTR